MTSVRTFPLIIDGQATCHDPVEVRDPATQEVVGLSSRASPAHVDAAVAAAARAFRRWRLTSEDERKAACKAIADKVKEHAEELAVLLTREQGKSLAGMGSRFEVMGMRAWMNALSRQDLAPSVLQDDKFGRIEMHRRTLGVVGLITPWNWPLMIANWHIMPAVRTGNTVVCKPSPHAPLSTIRLIELMNEVLPAGVVNCVPGGEGVGPQLTSHRDIQKIAFTGSTPTGRRIMASASETLKRLTLELGGNDAAVVLPDNDPKAIAEKLFWGAFVNSGQTCTAIKRLYVHDDLYDAVCTELTDYARSVPMGHGLDEAVRLGPMQNQAQWDTVSRLVYDARGRGARVLLGGEPHPKSGLFYPVTLVADVQNGVPLVDEEQFGPALPIIRFRDIDEVIGLANENQHGLGGSVWSRNVDEAVAIGTQMECGSLWINSHGILAPVAPFGGVKSSGLGVESGLEGLHEYTSIQVIYS